jgi:hypothetical protein
MGIQHNNAKSTLVRCACCVRRTGNSSRLGENIRNKNMFMYAYGDKLVCVHDASAPAGI